MGVAALITWSATVLAGLYMLTVWLIENDVSARRAAPSQLPVPVLFSHLTLAVSGLAVWVAYLILDQDVLAWTALGMLGTIALLGLTMFARWIPVYREPVAAALPAQAALSGYAAGRSGYAAAQPGRAAGRPAGAGGLEATLTIPAEGNFPLVVVAAHGLLATATIVLVLLTALGVGGS